MSETRRSWWIAGAALVGLGFVAACSNPSAPNQVDEPKDEPSEQPGTALLQPAPDRAEPAARGLDFVDGPRFA